MRKWLELALFGALLASGCSSPAPPPPDVKPDAGTVNGKEEKRPRGGYRGG